MIRINLAQNSARVNSPFGAVGEVPLNPVGEMGLDEKELQKQGLIRAFIVLAIPIAMIVYEKITIPELKDQIANMNARMAELQEFNSKMEASVQEIKKFKEDEAKIQARIKYLDLVSKGRQSEIKILDLVQQIIPEKAWLTRLDFKEGKLALTGFAVNDFEVSSFMEALAKSVFFSDVKLDSSNEQVLDGMNLKKFEILCQIGDPAT